jgi:hypothetical protein
MFFSPMVPLVLESLARKYPGAPFMVDLQELHLEFKGSISGDHLFNHMQRFLRCFPHLKFLHLGFRPGDDPHDLLYR